MKTVQVAIPDPVYADLIRSLLLEDGRHHVTVARAPDPSLDGVMVVDAGLLISLPGLANEVQRVVVMAHKQRDDLSKMWDAGARHVLFYGDPPQQVRAAVLGLELSLAAHGASAS